MPPAPDNLAIAEALDEVANLLEAQGANPFRVRAYRNAARTVREVPRPVAEIVEESGPEGLEGLAGIGPSLSSTIGELVATGRLGMLERLRGAASPEELFASVPGIGKELARRIHDELDIDTLEELELAAHDGRLTNVPGFGDRRVLAVREALAGMLSRSARRRARRIDEGRATWEPARESPSVAALLDVDDEYRRRSEAGELRRIAPRRFNPSGQAWLPVLHAEREGWSVTALFSNSVRAHRLGTTRDWVVLYFERDGHEAQCTVVTESQGPLAGRRVIRGREAECAAHYAQASR